MDVSNVTNMSYMFYFASAFNNNRFEPYKDIVALTESIIPDSAWTVLSNVDVSNMFSGSGYTSPIIISNIPDTPTHVSNWFNVVV